MTLARRRLLGAGLAALPLAPFAPGRALARADDAACRVPAPPTPAQTTGPFFLASAPERAALREAGVAGDDFRLEGLVAAAGCGALAGVRVDLWQADGRGAYDVAGFRLRGFQLTDAAGRFAFDTVRPGRYPGRTPHFHLRLTPSRGSALTTQLYLPGEPGNARDPIFRPELAVALAGETRGAALLVLG
jgi:protocatechuate 3,4-dioxygenase beta subunit